MNDRQLKKYVWQHCKTKHPEIKGFVFDVLKEIALFGKRYGLPNKDIKTALIYCCKKHKQLLTHFSVDCFNGSDDKYFKHVFEIVHTLYGSVSLRR